MSNEFGDRNPRPANRIVPGPEFVYPCRAWLERTPQSWEDADSKLQQVGKELFRLERSIAFLSSAVPDRNDIDLVSHIVQRSTPALDVSSYEHFDEALRALFEPLGPWTAAIVMDSSDREDWQYCLMKGLARYLHIVMPDILRLLPESDSRVLSDDLDRAKERLQSGDVLADLAADIKARKAKEQLQMHAAPRITLSQRLSRFKDKVLRRRKPVVNEQGKVAKIGDVTIFSEQA